MDEQKLVTGTGWYESVTLPVGSCCNIFQYRLLQECSELEDTALWTEYRKQNPQQEIQLVGAELSDAKLPHAELRGANLQHAVLVGANLQHAGLQRANLQHCNFEEADLQYALLRGADLQHADLTNANLQHATLWDAALQHADLDGANLHETECFMTHLEGARIQSCIIRDARFSHNTLDSQTDFTGSNIHEAIMTPQLEAQLQYNMRRIHWREETTGKMPRWGKLRQLQHLHSLGIELSGHIEWWQWIKGFFLWTCAVIWQCIRWLCFCKPTRLFWWASDYGTSSARLLGVFFFLALGFAGLYWWQPETVLGLSSVEVDGVMVHVEGWRLGLRSFYFSVVTMTTLGFGDIHANPRSGWGHVFLMAQVLLGYFLLGALITRFGIMFTTNAPCPKIPRAKIDKWYYPLSRLWDRTP